MNSKICVIGCGWLGFPLAKTLIELGNTVHGSTTSKDKIKTLEKAGIIPFLIHFTSEGVTGNITSCLENCKTLIVNIPPGLRKNSDNDYVKQMTHFVNHIESSSVENVLFIGSTSVYDDSEDFPVIREDSLTSNSKTALKLLEVEALFQQNKNFKTTILRFGGLFGDDRHPATYLSGKTNLKNGEAPVNLIHREDCVSIIISVVKNNIWDTIINASTPSHPTKKDYYTSICKALELPIPEFDNTTTSKGKIIDSSKLVQLLDYEYKVKL
ncbi:NAD(P)-binding domain-containing protein [Psychroserpens sp. AS72]|uniref:NAD(P)-binding domain-containing protein n=1 Tax=Psychroserpens sp. AS72 TaxID=3135775 RepID=UPI00317033C6